MIHAVVVEDEPLAAQYLRALLHATGKVEIVGMVRDGQTALSLCVEAKPEVAFLDVCLPGSDGLVLAMELTRLPFPPLLVFTTGHTEYAAGAFRVAAVDYLLKPLEPTQIGQTVARLEARLTLHSGDATPLLPSPELDSPLALQNDRLPVKKGQDDVIQLLSRGEIMAVLRHDRRSWIHTAQEEFATYYSLEALMHWLGTPLFLRVSRESIVNTQAIAEVIHYGDRLYRVRLRDRQKTEIEASRSGSVCLAALLKPPF